MAVTVAVVGAARVVLAADRAAAAAPGQAPEACDARRSSSASLAAGAVLAVRAVARPAGVLRVVPLPRVPLDRARHVAGTSCPATPATSRSATARSSAPACTRRRCWPASSTVPFLWTLPAGRARWPRCWAWRSARWCSACARVRGELFALLTLAVTFVLATIVLNTPIDGGPGVYLSAVPVPPIGADAAGHVLPAGAGRCGGDAG